MPISKAIDELRKGKMIILMDDEGRENEGDLVMLAEKVTPEAINFMVKEGRGLVCTPLSKAICDRLNFQPMVTSADGNCNFTVSVDVKKGTTTGISAADRALTIRRMVDPLAQPSDFMRPGHVFPLISEKGGVFERPGHTEASTDLAVLAGFQPAAVICEILNNDGTMARRDDLEQFAQKHGLHSTTIEALLLFLRSA